MQIRRLRSNRHHRPVTRCLYHLVCCGVDQVYAVHVDCEHHGLTGIAHRPWRSASSNLDSVDVHEHHGVHAHGFQYLDCTAKIQLVPAGMHPPLGYMLRSYTENHVLVDVTAETIRLFGRQVQGEILPASQLRDQMSIEAIGDTDRWDMGYHSPGWFGTFAPHVLNLTPFIERHGFDVSAYPDLVINSHMTSSAREGEYIALPTTPAAPMLIHRADWFSHPDEQAAFEEEFGRALEVPRTFAELREVAGFFTREAGEMLAGEELERDLYGWTDALGAGVGITRSFIVVLYSAGISGWDEDFQPDVGHPIVNEVADYFVDLAKNTAPREAQNWGFLEGLEMFRDGRLAMATMWPQGVGIVEAEGGDANGNVGYSTLPLWEGNLKGFTQGTPFLGGGGVFIFDTPNADEAFKFLKWMLQDNEVEWGKRSLQFSRKAHFQSEELRTLRPYYKEFPAHFRASAPVGIHPSGNSGVRRGHVGRCD